MKKSVNKAQVSIFIIIAIVLIVSIFILFYIFGTKQKWIPNPFKSDIDVIKDKISECMNSQTKEALRRIGIQGGYNNKPEKYYDLNWAFIPYYYYEGQFLMPPNSKIESELGSYVDDNFKPCLDELEFKNYEVSYGSSSTKASIEKGKVEFKIDMPVSAKKEEQTTVIELKDMPVVYNSSLFEILEVARYITDSHKENATMICINCVVEMCKQRNLYFDMFNYPKTKATTLVMLSENRTLPEPYIFEFLNKYPKEE